MKKTKRENLLKQISAAALLLGIMSPAAFAEISPKEGLSLAELNRVIRNLDVVQEGNKIVITGEMPERCARNAEVVTKYVDGKHALTVKMPDCNESFVPNDQDVLVDASSRLNEGRLADKTGPVVIRHYKRGDNRSPKRTVDEALVNGDDKKIEIIGQETRDAAAAEEKAKQDAITARAQAQADARRLQEQLNELQTNVAGYCKNGDFEGVGRELEAATEILGDVSELLVSVSKQERKKLEADFNKANTAEEVDAAFTAMQSAAARQQGWDDEDKLAEKYAAKRIEILQALVDEAGDGETSYREAEAAIKTLEADLAAVGLERKKRAEIASIYGALAARAANKGNTKEALRLSDRAKRYHKGKGGAEARDALDKFQMQVHGADAKKLTEAYKECLKKNPSKMDSCERQFQGQIKQAAENMKAMLQQRSGSEEGQQALNDFNQEYAGIFGGGASFTIAGYGTMSQMPGTLERMKQETYVQALQQQQMQMQMRYMQQMGGGSQMMMGLGNNTGSNFFQMK
jgi:hypothetical protein